MKNYLKLTNFEFNRFSKYYGSLIVLIIVGQLAAVFLTTRTYMASIKEMMLEQHMTEAAAISEMGQFSFYQVAYSTWFTAPILLSIAALLLFSLFIWYGDWLGKNTFIYRLLMLPVERVSLFFSKLTVVFLSVLGLVAVQVVMLLVEMQLIKQLVPALYLENLSLAGQIRSLYYFDVLLPPTYQNFFIHYGIGLLFLIVLFTVILLERSFKVKGMIAGIIYGIGSVYLFLLPLSIQTYLGRALLFPSENFLALTAMGILIASTSIFISRYLLNKKVTV